MIERAGSAISTLIMAIAAITCIVISGYFNYLFGSGWGPTAYEAIGLGVVFVALDVLKSFLPGKIVTALRNWHIFYALGATAAFLALVALSISSAIGFYSTARSAKTAGNQSMVVKVASLRQEISDIEDRKPGYQQISEPGRIRAKLASMRTNRRWTSTKGCTNATASRSRTFCAKYHGIEGELAGAIAAQKDRASLEIKRAQLRKLIDNGGLKPVNPQAETIAAALAVFEISKKISTENVEFGLRLTLPIFVEIGAAFGLFLAFRHGGHRKRPKRTEAAKAPPTIDVIARTKNPDIPQISKFSAAALIGDDRPEYDENGKLIIQGNLI